MLLAKRKFGDEDIETYSSCYCGGAGNLLGRAYELSYVLSRRWFNLKYI